jgi:hypothetical protein
VRLFCVCVVLLRRADPPSKEFYSSCKKNYETEEEAKAKQRAVQPLIQYTLALRAIQEHCGELRA